MYWLAPPYSQVLWVNTSNNFRESQPLTLPVNSCSRRFEVEKKPAVSFLFFGSRTFKFIFGFTLFNHSRYCWAGWSDQDPTSTNNSTDGWIVDSLNSREVGERLGLLVHFWFINWTWKSLETFNHYFTQWTINRFSLFFSSLCVFACMSWKKDDWRIIDSILEPEVEASLRGKQKKRRSRLFTRTWVGLRFSVPLVDPVVLVLQMPLYRWTWFFLPGILWEERKKESWVHWQCLPSARPCVYLRRPFSPLCVCACVCMVIYVL